jgi:hypothetical protein
MALRAAGKSLLLDASALKAIELHREVAILHLVRFFNKGKLQGPKPVGHVRCTSRDYTKQNTLVTLNHRGRHHPSR